MDENILQIAKLLPKLEDFNHFIKEIPYENEITHILSISATYINGIHEKNDESSTETRGDKGEIYYLLESLSEKMWENINVGHFSEVPLIYRKIYAVSNFFKIIFLLFSSRSKVQLEKCHEILDKSLLIGCTEDLYKSCPQFIKQLDIFLNENLGSFKKNLLPKIDPLPYKEYTCDIPVLECPSIEIFREKYFKRRKPALLKSIINHWPALEKWKDPNYLLRIAGNRTVPIEIGSNYANEDWTQDLIKIKDFLFRQFGNDKRSSTLVPIEYLAQHELFDQIPQLKEDIRVPDYCYSCMDEQNTTDSENNSDITNVVDIKAWLGPAGTISQMHQDPKHNILCQVFGCKKIILASPEDTEFVYPFKNGILTNTSELNAEEIDFNRFPLAKKAKFYKLYLQEGEGVYIPPKWWHYVKSLSKSFSVSFWWE